MTNILKPVIFYKTHLGTTKEYVKWLQSSINADLFLFRQLPKARISKYNLVIISSGTYMGQMPLVKFLIKIWPQIKNKTVIVIAIGGVEPNNEASIRSYKTIPLEIRNNIKYFKIAGKVGEIKPLGEIKFENLNEILSYIQKLA